MSDGYIHHGWTPGKFGGPCRVRLARGMCPWSREEHDPDLPPENVNAFGRIISGRRPVSLVLFDPISQDDLP